MVSTERVACRVCGSNTARLLFAGRDLAFEQPGEFPVVRCSDCGLVYLRERPISDEIGRYYPESYTPYRTAVQDEPNPALRWARRRNLARRARVVARASPQAPGRLLDVGCATGGFLDFMRAEGWTVHGVEINHRAVEYARERFGLDVHHGDLLDAGLPAGAFDAITFWDVLEHTYDPMKTLLEARRLLDDGGAIVLTLPNWESVDRSLFGRAWIGYDIPRHLYAFPRPALRRLLLEAGFDLEATWTGLGSYFAFLASVRLWAGKAMLRKLIWRGLNVPGVRFAFQPGFTILDRLGKSGSRVVVARKSANTGDPHKDRRAHGDPGTTA